MDLVSIFSVIYDMKCPAVGAVVKIVVVYLCEFLHSCRVGAVVRSVNGNFPCYLSAQRLSLSKTTRTAAKLFLGGNYNFCKLVIGY